LHWEGFSFLSPQTSCNGLLFSFPRALSLHPEFWNGSFLFSHQIKSWDMGLLEHKGGWDCTGWGNVHSNSHLSLFKPSPLFIAGICFFSVGFQIWIYMIFNAERSERIWVLLLGFLFTESSCSQIFMSRITNVHAMLAQRVTGRAVRPAEHTARQIRDAKEDNTWLLSLIFLTLIQCCFLGSTPKRQWERGTGRLFFTMLTGVNWGIIFHWRIFTRIPLIQRENSRLGLYVGSRERRNCS